MFDCTYSIFTIRKRAIKVEKRDHWGILKELIRFRLATFERYCRQRRQMVKSRLASSGVTKQKSV